MRFERIVDKMLGVETGHVAEEIAIAHQHEGAIHTRPDHCGRLARAHRIGDHAAFERAPDGALPESKDLVAQIHDAPKVPQFRLPLEPLVKLRENYRMLR